MAKRKKIIAVILLIVVLLISGSYIYLFMGAKIKNVSDEVTKGNEGTKSLVVYFSRLGETSKNIDAVSSATVNSNVEMTGSDTEAAAKLIQSLTGADMYQIRTEHYYRNSFFGTAATAWIENTFHLRPKLAGKPENLDQYDTIYIGYPIWWGIAAWPVDNFIKNNDFTGKTVIPFCTSASSGLGDSGKLLEKMAGTGNWQDGERFRSGASDSDIISWVDDLGL